MTDVNDREGCCANRLSWRAWCVLIAYAGGLFLWQLGSARTFTGHESYPAQGAREMLATGDWLVPRVAGVPWLEKPPLTHWAIAAAGSVAGEVNELVARLPSALAGLMGVLLVASMAARWFGHVHGLLAGLAQATMVYTVTYARLAEADIYLWAIVLVCWWLFTRRFIAPAHPFPSPLPSPSPILASRPGDDAGAETWMGSAADGQSREIGGRWLPVAFFVALGVTQLTKGPLFGIVVALTPCAVFMLWSRNFSVLRWATNWPGLALGLLVAGAWPLAIWLRFPEAAELWYTHTFGRLGDNSFNPKPTWYYLTTLPWQVLPWTAIMLVALPASAWRAWRRRSDPDRFLWAWLVGLLVLLSRVRAKHHHYLIYALPPCSIWAAEGLLRLRDLVQRFPARPSIQIAASLVALALWLGGYAWATAKKPAYATDVLALGALVTLGAIVVGFCCARRLDRPAGASLFAALWLAYAWVHTSIFPKRDEYRAETAYWRSLDDYRIGDRPLLLFGVDPARSLLYVGTPIEVFGNPRQLRERALRLEQPLVVSCAAHEQLLREVGRPAALAEVAPGRRGPFAHYKLYRMEWKQWAVSSDLLAHPRRCIMAAKEPRPPAAGCAEKPCERW